MYKVLTLFFFAGLLISCGGSSSSNGSPKDLNFKTQKTAEDFSAMVLYAITSTRSQFLPAQFSEDNDIDAATLKVMANSYAQAIKKGDWIREDEEIKTIDDNSLKVFKWLDKRRRVAIKISVDIEKNEKGLSIEKLDFFSNLEVLGNGSYQ